ncbi:MAG: hypothetical protein BWY11_02066 [Firmicutes bacterium ADurb.Bin182]|nr:MAG: hypothetical protein BWY11_02066 [Firmicutes bacterium ADurb.Bin182]
MSQNSIQDQGYRDDRFFDLEDHIGETVTIFTTSGGESGSGFTGILLFVNKCFVRLTTRIGPAPACALGNACSRDFDDRRDFRRRGFGCCFCGGRDRRDDFVHTVGSNVDIPLDRIAAVVFNSV